MRWDRLERSANDWRMQTIDTSDMNERDVADEVLEWCRQALAGNAPALSVND